MRDGWERTTLGQIANLTIGRTPPRDDPGYWTHDLARPFCTIADMTSSEVMPTREGVTELAEADGKAKRFKAGTLLMSFKLTIGRVGFAAVDLFPNEAIVGIEPGHPGVDPHYLAVWLESRDLSAGSGRAVKGNTLNGPALRAIEVRLPSLTQQRRITQLLSEFDRYISTAKTVGDTAETALDLLRGQLVWTGAALVPLSDMCSIESGLVDPGLTPDLPHIGIERIESGTGRLLDVQSAAADGVTSSKFLYNENDVIYSKISPNLRKATFPRQSGLCSSDAYPLRPKVATDPRFLLHLLLSVGFTTAAVARSGGTKMPRINRTELFDILVPQPPLHDQRRIGVMLTDLADFRDRCVTARGRAIGLRSRLLADLTSGTHEIPDSYDAELAAAV